MNSRYLTLLTRQDLANNYNEGITTESTLRDPLTHKISQIFPEALRDYRPPRLRNPKESVLCFLRKCQPHLTVYACHCCAQTHLKDHPPLSSLKQVSNLRTCMSSGYSIGALLDSASGSLQVQCVQIALDTANARIAIP